jgi:ribose transport system substrate-binding protein
VKPKRTARFVFASSLAIVMALAAACGSSSSGANSPNPADPIASGASLTDPSGPTSSAVAEATRDLAPYTGHPNSFPVTTPLKRKPRTGTTLAFLQCSDPICALFAQLIVPAAKTMGVKVTITKGGASAASLQQAMASIIAEKPAAVLLPAVDPVEYRTAMSQLNAAGIPVVSQGIADTSSFPAIKGVIFGAAADTLAGKLLADWVVEHNGNHPSVFYSTSELTFNSYLENGFKAEMAALCPSCSVRYVEIPVTAIGTTAPSLVTNDLRAHPDTKLAVFSTEEAADGLPAALSDAGIHIAVTGFAPDPEVLSYIKAGSIASGLGYDALTSTWTQVDEAARLLTGQGLTASERKDAVVFQMLTKPDIKFDPSHGFTGYPTGPARFAKLWSGS